MQRARSRHRWTVLALALACALGSIVPAAAQDSREQQLEQRVDQLEKQLAEVKAMLQQQHEQKQQEAKAPVTKVAAAPAKPAFKSAPGVTVAMHGFVNATAFHQDKSFIFGNGQNAEFPVPGSTGSLSGADIRNSRFWFDFSGAKFTGNWTGGGRIEADFFGGFNGTGAFSRQQPTPRLRQAYLDLVNADSGTKIRIGQQWDLMFPLDAVPASLAHVAFPLGFGTGMVGWRFPGVVVMQDLNHGSEGVQWRLDLGAFDGSWAGPDNNINYLSAGNAGFNPQIEAKLRAQGRNWAGFLSARYAKVDLSGVDGTTPTPIKKNIQSLGYELGGTWKPGDLVLKGAVYHGKGLGPIFGALTQFGDIQETGGYAQVGYNFTPNWSGYAFYGMAKPNRNDTLKWLGTSARLKNRQTALSLQYAAGSYAFALEWLYDQLDSTSDGGVTTTKTKGNQVSVSAMYKF